MTQDKRDYYLDWIRIGVILLLVPFHGAITFTVEGLVFIKHPEPAPLLDVFMWFLSIWIMPALFVVSGIASYHSLRRRTLRQFLRERREKLLIPFIAGVVLVCPPMAYLKALFVGTFHGSIVQYYPRFFLGGVYPEGDFNWAHLWFLIYLYVFTLILIPVFNFMTREDNRDRIVAATAILEKGLWIYIIAIPLMISEMLLRPFFPGLQNLVWDWANFTAYLVLVLYGFLFAMNQRIIDNIQRIRLASLILALLLFATAFALIALGAGDALAPMFPAYNVLMVFSFVFAVLGYARRFMNRPFGPYRYLNNASFALYIFHFTPITVVAYFIVRADMNVWLKYLIIVAVSYASTFAIYEILRRLPLIRYIFGVKTRQFR